MARKSIIVSDISGREIRDPKDSAKVAISYGDARRGRVELDVLADEVNDLASKGRKVAGGDAGPRPKADARPEVRHRAGSPSARALSARAGDQ